MLFSCSQLQFLAIPPLRVLLITGSCVSWSPQAGKWTEQALKDYRHGARLDAADKQWHLTSPTPYDPPLTYGGWNQSKALGARIANILRSRETDDEVPVTNGADILGEADRRKRTHKVIIHSSPFLRCVQTSVAISAGLAQNPGHIHHRPSSSQSQTKVPQMHSSPRIRPTSASDSPNLAPIPEPVNGKLTDQQDNIKKSTVRVDAFLGEWLSPDYFEQITPPPSSIMMVAGAKADLLRREDYSNLTQVNTSSAQNVGFPGGWGSPVVSPKKDEDDGPLLSLSGLAQALPRRDRTSSLSSMGSNGSRHRGRSPNSLSIPVAPEHGVYQPPVPNYAILGNDSIPSGYVAHARDACVDVDYQWDSMRDPQSWGNGGEYGEEWSSMHKRFRRGLGKMINWYKESNDPGKLMTKTSAAATHLSADTEDNDEDTDLVIILVTHGAGCNALIGALTNQPVLLDVGMSSLTMAVRKPTPTNSPTSTPSATPKSHSRANSRYLTVSDQYDVKLVANTEHLRRSSASTPTSSRTPSIAGLSTFRERFNPIGGSDGAGFGTKPLRSATTSGNFGSIRRAASIATPGPRSYVPTRQSSIGLWSAPAAPEDTTEPEDDMILNFGDENAADSSPLQDVKDEEAIEKDGDEEDDVAPLGLWGSPRPPGVAEKIREIAPKRRWTVSERG